MGIMESQARIRAAAKATDAVDAAINRARAMLEHYRDRNVLGVFAHPHALRAHLAEAREAIAAAAAPPDHLGVHEGLVQKHQAVSLTLR